MSYSKYMKVEPPLHLVFPCTDINARARKNAMVLLHFLLLVLLSFSSIQAQSFTVQLSKSKVVANELFTLTYKLEGSESRPKFPDLSPLKIEGGPNTASNFVMINGKVSQNVSYSFVLRAPKEGTYTIGPAKVDIGGKVLQTQSLKLTASKAPPVPKTDDTKGIDIFILPRLSKEEVFVGERLTVTYELYTNQNIRDLDLAENPLFDGFGVEVNGNLSQSPRSTTRDGVNYRVFNIRQFHLFPQHDGEINIPNLTFRGVVSKAVNRSDPFSLFGVRQRTSRLITSAKVTVKVKPWPEPVPSDFSGLVGDYKLDASLDKTRLNTGETARLRVMITGEGNIRLQGVPKLNIPESFDLFDPEPREGVRVNAEGVNGQKVFDFLLAPREPGVFELPAVTVSVLNPETGNYERMTGNLPAMTVGGKALAGNVPSQISPQLEDDIRPLTIARPSWRQPVSLLWLPLTGLPLVLLLFFGVWLKRKADIEARPETAIRRSMAAARRQLAEAQKLLEAGDNNGFYTELRRTLWDYLENRLNLPGSSQTRQVLLEKLSERGVSQESQNQLVRIIDESEMALYAPGAVSPPKDAYSQALTLLDQLESTFNPEV